MSVTPNGQTTTWVRYSKYMLHEARNNTRYVLPVEGSAQIIYDPADNRNALSAALAGGREVHLGNRDNGVLIFANGAGLPGVLAEYVCNGYTVQENDNYAPAGTFHKDVLVPPFFPFSQVEEHSCKCAKLTGRSDAYHTIFSPLYCEPVEDVAYFLEMLYLEFVGDGEPQDIPLDPTSLRTMLRHQAAVAKAAGNLHVCVTCGKVFEDDDPNAEACSVTCQNQADIEAERIWFNPEPVGGG